MPNTARKAPVPAIEAVSYERTMKLMPQLEDGTVWLFEPAPNIQMPWKFAPDVRA